MVMQQEIALPTTSRIALSPQGRFMAGLAMCAAIAAAAIAAADYAPVVGAPVFAIAFGVIITNTLREPLQIAKMRMGDVSKMCLKGGIILLGASLDLGVIYGPASNLCRCCCSRS